MYLLQNDFNSSIGGSLYISCLVFLCFNRIFWSSSNILLCQKILFVFHFHIFGYAGLLILFLLQFSFYYWDLFHWCYLIFSFSFFAVLFSLWHLYSFHQVGMFLLCIYFYILNFHFVFLKLFYLCYGYWTYCSSSCIYIFFFKQKEFFKVL